MEKVDFWENPIFKGNSSEIDFHEALDLVTRGEYNEAAELSVNMLQKGCFDIRFICYYLFGLCSQDFSGNARYVFDTLSKALTEKYELLTPEKYKEKQCQNAFKWLMVSIFDLLNYQEKKSSRLAFTSEVLECYVFFQKKLGDSPLGIDKTVVAKIRSFIEDRVSVENTKDKSLDHDEPKADEKNITSGKVEKSYQVVNGSLKWEALIDKLQMLDELQKKNADIEAAVLFKNIYQNLVDFKPLEYFPEIFSSFYKKTLDKDFQKIINKAESSLTSAQWYVLEEIVASDHRLLFDNNISLPDIFPHISLDKFKKLFGNNLMGEDNSSLHHSTSSPSQHQMDDNLHYNDGLV